MAIDALWEQKRLQKTRSVSSRYLQTESFRINKSFVYLASDDDGESKHSKLSLTVLGPDRAGGINLELTVLSSEKLSSYENYSFGIRLIYADYG